MTKEIKIDNKNITIIYDENTKSQKLPVIVLNTYEEDGMLIFSKTKNLTNKDFILLSISNLNWNSEMSPWYMDKLFKNEDDYSGDADNYIDLLVYKIIPRVDGIIENEINKKIDYYSIAGYSLAGLFSIYSLYKTDIFNSAISCSGSLWYPNFIEYAKSNSMKINPDKIYFSLGNKERNTKIKLMSSVEDKTRLLEQYYSSLNINTFYEENEGNHFQNVSDRISKGIAWILNN